MEQEIIERLQYVIQTYYSGTARRMAHDLNISEATMSKIMNGTTSLTTDKIIRLHDITGMSADWLLFGAGSSNIRTIEDIKKENEELKKQITALQMASKMKK